MDANVPQQVTAELTQILSNLVLGDNEIRSNAEKVVEERLAQTPELYMLAMAQYTITAATEQMRSFSLILLRRLLFRSISSTSGSRLVLYDQLSESTRGSIERTVIQSLLDDSPSGVKNKAADTITDLANASFQRSRPWPELQEAVFRAVGGNAASRESAYRIMERCTVLIADVPAEVLVRGVNDPNPDVRLSALKAAVTYLSHHTLNSSPSVMIRALSTLPTAPQSHRTRFLNAITPLASSHPSLFMPHLKDLLLCLPPMILNQKDYDAGPTPTVGRPFPKQERAFTFPPTPTSMHRSHDPDDDDDDEDDRDEREEIRKAALEFMVSLSEAKPNMVRRIDGWVGALVRCCLDGMGELDDSPEELNSWLNADPSNDPTDSNYPHVFEQALDRLSCAFNGKPVLQIAFQFIPGMLASHDWRLRHAGLMAIAALGEGGAKVMQNELGKIVSYVCFTFTGIVTALANRSAFSIPNADAPEGWSRARILTGIRESGMLCANAYLEELIQAQYHSQIFAVLIPTLESPEPRVHSHAAAALINFCEGVEHDTLIPYLDPIVERLLKLLHSSGGNASSNTSSSGNGVSRGGAHGFGYVQEQVVTTLAMVADASEATFAKHYSSIMPLLLNVLRHANGVEHKKLRWKAMECAGLIAIAVGRDMFRPDAGEFVELLMRIQNSPVDAGDTMLNHYLISTWAKVCQAMGTEFEPYLPVVMPPLLQAASAKADVSVWDDDEESRVENRDGWETMSLDGQQVGIKTSVIEEKCQAFETLVIYCSTLGAKFAPYMTQSLELVLPSLRFYFHEGVREACALVLPMLLSCGKQSNTLTPQILSAVFAQLITTMAEELDSSFLASLYKCFTDCVRVIGGAEALAGEYREQVMEATKRQLTRIAEKRKVRADRANSRSTTDPELDDEREEVALLEELEDFALEDMGKMLRYFDPNHPLLFAVGSVGELGIRKEDWDSESEG